MSNNIQIRLQDKGQAAEIYMLKNISYRPKPLQFPESKFIYRVHFDKLYIKFVSGHSSSKLPRRMKRRVKLTPLQRFL